MELDPWGPILSVLFEDGSSDFILGVLQRAGVPIDFKLSEQENYSHTTRKRAYQRRLGTVHSKLDRDLQLRLSQSLARILATSEERSRQLNDALSEVGWNFQNNELTRNAGEELFKPANPVAIETGEGTKVSSLTPSQAKAFLLLRAIYERTKDQTRPVDDVTDLKLGFSEEETKAAFRYLSDKRLIQTFSLPYAARINAHGIDVIETPDLGAKYFAEDKRMADEKTETSLKRKPRKIFIVHGHDTGAREGVARFVEKLGFEAVILQEQANQGRTIIEKVEAHGDVGFAIILLTPDDRGSKVGEELQPRPRQNVLLELGYFMGRLGRENICALTTSNAMDLPTDFAGVVWQPLDHEGGWKSALGRELRAAGFKVDFNLVL
jgi:predicted nucleotide-binding protein